MNTHRRSSHHRQTKFIRLITENCDACWKCIDVCQNKVIGKIDIFFHKHSIIRNAPMCIGCRKCIKVCKYSAIEAIKKNVKTMSVLSEMS